MIKIVVPICCGNINKTGAEVDVPVYLSFFINGSI